MSDTEVAAGVCWAGMFDGPQSATQHSFIQIYNPPGSSKRIFVDKTITRCLPQQEVGLVWVNSSLGNLKTDILPYNLKNGVQTGYSAQIRTGLQTSEILYPFTDVQEDITGGCFREFPQAYPCILDAGSGLVVIGYSLNTQLLAGFYWREL